MSTVQDSKQEPINLDYVLEFAHFRNACQTSRLYSFAIDLFSRTYLPATVATDSSFKAILGLDWVFQLSSIHRCTD